MSTFPLIIYVSLHTAAYGKILAQPLCDLSKAFCALAKCSNLTCDQLDILKGIGFDIQASVFGVHGVDYKAVMSQTKKKAKADANAQQV